jgi:WD40 repeat protein
MYLHNLGQIGEPKAFAHPDTVRKAVWAAGDTVMTGGQDGAIRTWDVRTGQETRAAIMCNGHVMDMEVSMG